MSLWHLVLDLLAPLRILIVQAQGYFCDGTPFWRFFLRRTQAETAFWNFFIAISITNTLWLNFGYSMRSGTYFGKNSTVQAHCETICDWINCDLHDRCQVWVCFLPWLPELKVFAQLVSLCSLHTWGRGVLQNYRGATSACTGNNCQEG
jgi:hypothetical protein